MGHGKKSITRYSVVKVRGAHTATPVRLAPWRSRVAGYGNDRTGELGKWVDIERGDFKTDY